MSNRQVWVICPYCGTRQRVLLKDDSWLPQVVLCDCEDVPGCDRCFAVEVEMAVHVTYYRLNETEESPDLTDQRLAEYIAETENDQCQD